MHVRVHVLSSADAAARPEDANQDQKEQTNGYKRMQPREQEAGAREPACCLLSKKRMGFRLQERLAKQAEGEDRARQERSSAWTRGFCHAFPYEQETGLAQTFLCRLQLASACLGCSESYRWSLSSTPWALRQNTHWKDVFNTANPAPRYRVVLSPRFTDRRAHPGGEVCPRGLFVVLGMVCFVSKDLRNLIPAATRRSANREGRKSDVYKQTKQALC